MIATRIQRFLKNKLLSNYLQQFWLLWHGLKKKNLSTNLVGPLWTGYNITAKLKNCKKRSKSVFTPKSTTLGTRWHRRWLYTVLTYSFIARTQCPLSRWQRGNGVRVVVYCAKEARTIGRRGPLFVSLFKEGNKWRKRHIWTHEKNAFPRSL